MTPEAVPDLPRIYGTYHGKVVAYAARLLGRDEADDVAVRERIHNEGHGAVYRATRRPVRLVYSEAHQSWPSARKREAQLADIEAW